MPSRPEAARESPRQADPDAGAAGKQGRGRRRRRRRRALLGLLLGLVLVVPILELGIRFLVLGDSGVARRLGAGLRRAENFADPRTDEDYWKLQYLFLDPQEQGPANHPDPVCGWTGYAVRDGTYEHLYAKELRGRRPVLLYGDSFAACNTEPDQCFQGILERSDLADRYVLVNYGVGGYGVDQIHLLIRQSIELWRGKDPIVVVSFLVDDDFNRNVLPFRCWPKPRFRIEKGELVPPGPVETDPDAWLEAHPPSIGSYLLRHLAHRRGLLPKRIQERLQPRFDDQAERKALGRALLEAIDADLRSRGIEYFLLAFHGEAGLDETPDTRWSERLVEETARDLRVPLMTTRPYLLAAAEGDRARARRFFGGAPKLVGHYNTMGNLVAFEALRAGLEGRFGEVDPSRVLDILANLPFDDADQRVVATMFGCNAIVRTRGRTGLARISRTPYPPFAPDEGSDPPSIREYLMLRTGEQGPTQVLVVVDGAQRRFRGRATSVARADLESPPEPLVLAIRVGGRLAWSGTVPFHPDGVDLDVDVSGAEHFEIAVERTGPDPASAWTHVAGARLEAVR